MLKMSQKCMPYFYKQNIFSAEKLHYTKIYSCLNLCIKHLNCLQKSNKFCTPLNASVKIAILQNIPYMSHCSSILIIQIVGWLCWQLDTKIHHFSPFIVQLSSCNVIFLSEKCHFYFGLNYPQTLSDILKLYFLLSCS